VTIQYNTIQYKTYNAPYVTKMLFVGAGTSDEAAMIASTVARPTALTLQRNI